MAISYARYDFLSAKEVDEEYFAGKSTFREIRRLGSVPPALVSPRLHLLFHRAHVEQWKHYLTQVEPVPAHKNGKWWSRADPWRLLRARKYVIANGPVVDPVELPYPAFFEIYRPEFPKLYSVSPVPNPNSAQLAQELI